jgi:hypothetical protein
VTSQGIRFELFRPLSFREREYNAQEGFLEIISG